jgi:hypothetical protein
MEVGDQEKDSPYRKWLSAKYKDLMQLLLSALEADKGRNLSMFIAFLDDAGLSILYEDRYFYDFWILLHQRSPVVNGQLNEEESSNTLLGEALTLLGNRTLLIEDGKGILNRFGRYSIQEMEITLEGDEYELS